MRGLGRSALSIVAVLSAFGCATTTSDETTMPESASEAERLRRTHLRTILDLWDFSDAAATAERMAAARDEATAAGADDFAAQLETQVARAEGLTRDFVSATERLDALEPDLERLSSDVRVRFLLERGRVLNTSGDPEASRALFAEAWDVARDADAHYLAVDAAHMLGIVAPEDERLGWNRTAIEYAESSGDEDARRWLGSLYNNTGWTLHDAGDADGALVLFERAVVAREEAGETDRLFVARWCVARCLRTLGRNDEALAMQSALAADRAEAGAPPAGFVHEELGELLLLAGEDEAARDEFKVALELLREVAWLRESDPGRIERIETLALEE